MSLDCKLNKEEFTAGDTVKLKVLLNIENSKDIKHVQGGALRLDIWGEEFATVHWTDTTAEDHYERESKPFFRLDKYLANYDDIEVTEGQLEYSFDYKLAKTLPSSFHTTNGHSSATVKYMVQVTLETPGFFSHDQIWECEFPVKAFPKAIPQDLKPKLLPPDLQDITFCCCFYRGSMTIGGVISKTVVSQYDTLTVGFAAENNSTISISQINFKLIQKTEFEARYKRGVTKEILASHEFKPEDLPGAEKVKSVNKDLVPEEVAKILFKRLRTENDPNKISVTILIRPDIRESYVGNCIRVSHEIEVRLMTPEMFTNPELSATIQVLPSSERLNTTEDGSQLVQASAANPRSFRTTSFVGIPDKTYEDFDEEKGDKNVAFDRRDLFVTPKRSSVRLEKSVRLHQESFSVGNYPVSFDGIIKAMDDTYEDRSLLERYLENESLGYKSILLDLTSKQYGTIVGKVNFVHDQAIVAKMLADVLGSKFTCKYVASACRLAASTNRVDVVVATAPLAVDRKENREEIEKCLSSFDKILISDAFNS